MSGGSVRLTVYSAPDTEIIKSGEGERVIGEKGAERKRKSRECDRQVGAKSCTLSVLLLSNSFSAEAGFSGRVVRDNVNLGQQRWETMQLCATQQIGRRR